MSIRYALAAILVGFCNVASSAGCGADDDQDRPDPLPPPPTCSALVDRSWQGTEVCYAIGDLAEMVSDELTTLWRTVPDVICAYLPTEVRKGACGDTLPMNAFYCRIDNAIGWDSDFMYQQYADFGVFAYVTIIAHEWGHRNQQATGLFDSDLTGFEIEQHADCQAGVFAAFEESRGLLKMDDVMVAFNALCALGGTSGWFDPDSHGSCGERVAAFEQGYLGGRQRLGDLCTSVPLDATLEICTN